MAGMKKFGNWAGVMRIATGLKNDLDSACDTSAKRFGLIAEKIAKKHISSQDLGWEPLDEKYKARKVKEGHSSNILVRTSSYFQAITSWSEKSSIGNFHIGYSGVKKKVTNDDGEEVADIAKSLEYGTDNMEARPLWQPTFTEAVNEWRKSSTPVHMYMKKLGI